MAPDAIILEFDGLPPTLNKTKGFHWSTHNEKRAYWREYARLTAEKAKARVIGAKAHLHYHISFADNRRHDADGIIGGLKPVQDGLVAGGVIVDDSIDDIECSYSFDRQHPRGFTITIKSLS